MWNGNRTCPGLPGSASSEAKSCHGRETEIVQNRSEAIDAADARTGVSAFKAAMRRHAAGVCILSTGTGDAVNGMAVTAATSFSAEPPAMLVCVNQSASICAQLSLGTCFCLTLLGTQHAAVAQAFSRKPAGRPRFDHGGWLLEPGHLPVLPDAPANVACRVERVLAYGSHFAFVGLVEQLRLGPDTASLVYRDGTYA